MRFLNKYFSQEVSATPLALFRICFGLVIFYEFGRLFWSDVGYIRYINTVFHFKYLGFEWVKQAPDQIMYMIFVLGSLASLAFALGLAFRWVSILLLILYSYVFLLDISYWNNHYYLFIILLFLFSLTNADKSLTIKEIKSPNLEARIPRWQLLIFIGQLGIVYFYGAISKLQNPDWFNNLSATHILTNSLDKKEWIFSEQTIAIIAWIWTIGGFLYDLLIIPILCFKRTFWLGVILSIGFHLTNHFFLTIGSFPFAMLGALVLFYPKFNVLGQNEQEIESKDKLSLGFRWVKVVLTIHFVLQIIIPLNHLFIPGSVFWTSEGKVGGWHMMSGSTTISSRNFLIVEHDKKGKPLESHPIDAANYLNQKQLRTLGKWPALVPQFASFIKKEAELAGFKNVKVYGDIQVSKNGRDPKPVVRIDQELSSLVPKSFEHNDYVLIYLDEGY